MRAWMINMREARGRTIDMAAKFCGCSVRLLRMIEEDDTITHPDIAARIANVYGMSVGQYNRLVHKKHRAKVLPDVKSLPTNADWYLFQRCIQNKPLKKAGG